MIDTQIRATSKSNRYIWADFCKGIAILLVLIGLSIQYSSDSSSLSIVFNYIYSFHMPLFMFLSGFCSYKEQYSWRNIVSRTRQLIIPFFTYFIISTLISKGCITLMDVRQLIVSPDTGCWFFWVLWIISTITIFIERVISYLNIRHKSVFLKACLAVSFSIIIWISGFEVFGLGLAALHIIWYNAGMIVRHYYQTLTAILTNLNILIISSITFIISAYFWKFSPYVFSPTNGSILIFSHAILTSLLGIFMTISLVHILYKHMAITSNIIIWIGTHTLGIYATHLYIINTITSKYSIPNSAFNSIELLCIYTLGSILLVKTMEYTTITQAMLLGKLKR